MLCQLSVENYALIERLEMRLDRSLNIITGETGAGKSILLGALGLLLGNKNEGSALKDGGRNCVVEGQFDIAGYGLEAFFDENELDFEPTTTIRRIITPAGKSRAFVNDAPVQLTVLRELGERLIDIHSQHRNLILSSEDFRIRALDTVAGNGETAARYAAEYARLGDLRRELAALRTATEAARRDEEWLRFQCNELETAALREGELAELEAEQAVLADADRIGETLTEIRNAFDDDETGVLVRLKGAETALSHLRDSYPAAAEAEERIRTALLDLKDLGVTLAEESERIESDPERLQRVDERLNTIYTLIRKYRVADLAELIALRDESLARLAAIDHGGERMAEAERAVAEAERAAEKTAVALRKAREKAAPSFASEIAATLADLGMADAVFKVEISDCGQLTPTGRDRVTYIFSANRGVTPQPVEKIASGGEISRVMLAMKSMLARSMKLPTIIFDEIDTGVSGRIADAMGGIISRLAESMQVVDITHLPQVASKGATHFVVSKRDGVTGIRLLDAAERVDEIAKMLSGSEITDAARTQARILLGTKLNNNTL